LAYTNRNVSTKIYDVAITGAGPAGSTLAYQLATSGIRTCIIDKETFPRKKACAGGVPPKIVNISPLNISSLIRNEVSSIRLSHKMKDEFGRSYPVPLLFTVVRETFDDFFLRNAVDAGTIFREHERVEKISFAGGSYSIITGKGEVRAGILVGADGAHGITARSMGMNPIDVRHVAIQIEVPLEKIFGHGSVEQTISLDWGFIKDGYGWLFPNGDFVSIGVMGPSHLGRSVKCYFAEWINYFGVKADEFEVHAQNIPHRISNRPITSGRALLIGDAAGMADFWTGEGIYHAIRSAQIAAEQIRQFLSGDAASLREYEMILNETILPELKASYSFSRLFNYGSLCAFHAMKKYSYPWDVLCRTMRGDRSFGEIKKRLRPDILLQKIFFKSKRGK
jgi:geranylgeranyl reductase family protein